ncbi:uridine kinase [Labilibaculum sp. A4]|uniref:Uridine kinase n=1 Tax=Labilibaculum euxinus TaxID=2686357 RepID=A0A425YCF2_9BACT|nr:uridine kinase [Labilibaculum euxinus]MDQ1769668.1 uridine kinase [Labilibaculum euxinus]MUP36619.1 uridine kinase [Labilibaculum euxinus]MVB05824.1 uridine kinase [Labilibaculum euxinus]MWN76225.1 uridine kinase [Labilibaculum euxinus]
MLIIGIAGGTGSGKTTVVRKIIERLNHGDVAVLPQDSYYRSNEELTLEERQEINFDHPRSIEFELLIEHVKNLKQGVSINQPIYSYITCLRSDETIRVEPKGVIIVEGLLILTDPVLRDLMDLKVFVDCDADDRLNRVIKRDIVERGRSVEKVLDRYEKTVKPMHLQFIEPSKRYADIIVPQGGNNIVAIDILTHFIQKNLIEHQ